MNNSGQQAARVFTYSGGIIIAVTLFLMYQLSEAHNRGETFTFTLAFISFQEALFFGTLAYNSLNSASGTATTPLRFAYVTTIVFYNFIATMTVILFTVLPYFQNIASKIYYTITIAETGLCLALMVILRIVDITHNNSHLAAEQARSNIELMLYACDRIFAFNQIHRWKLAGVLQQLAERIRFSEGLRRNKQLSAELLDLLDELESLIKTGGNDDAEQRAEQLANIILTNASRQA
ncbi:MAG: hypothetical protein HY253_14330 [Burkholderiales bacterium]|nr:hypothetical protein [Burkholderiales bacterium]